MLPFFVLLMVVLPGVLAAQPLQSAADAERNQTFKIRQETRTQVTYTDWGVPLDTCPQAILSYDTKGRLIAIREFYHCGDPYVNQTFEYDAAGRMTASAVGYVTNHCELVPAAVTLDNEGRVIQRELTSEIPGFWFRETYTWHPNGKLASLTQWRKVDGKLQASTIQTWPAFAQRELGAHSTVKDDRGLPREQRTAENGRVKSVLIFSYEHY